MSGSNPIGSSRSGRAGAVACGEALDGDDPGPAVRQVFEIPRVRPLVTEYRTHRLTCPRCGAATAGSAPPEAAPGFGPRARAIAALLAGAGRLSKRAVARILDGLFGLPISPAAVCDLGRRTASALASIHAEALGHMRTPPANVDETGRREGRRRAWLRAAVTRSLGVFPGRRRPGPRRLRGPDGPVAPGGGDLGSVLGLRAPAGRTPTGLLGPPPPRFPGDDRPRRLRFAGRRGSSGRLGTSCSRAGRGSAPGAQSRRTFATRTVPLAASRGAVDARSRACAAARPRRRRPAGRSLKVEPSPWTFREGRGRGADEQRGGAGVAPRGLLAEDQLRRGLGRRLAAGRAAPWTTIESCRRQGRDLLEFLIQAVEAHRLGGRPPSLLPAEA